MENSQVRKNLIFNILNVIVNIFIGIFYTPFLVNNLGIVAYGVLPLALIINQYVSVITGSLTSSLTRFYTIALQKGSYDEASKYLSTSFMVIIYLVIVLVLPFWIVVKNIENIFTIPQKLLESTRLLFVYGIFSFFLALFSSVFNISLYAINRLDLLNTLNVIRASCKFVFVFILFTSVEVNVSYVGLASLITEAIFLCISILFFFQFTANKVSISLKHYDFTAFKVVGITAIWTIIHLLGDTGIYRVDNVLVNIFWSSKESGILGAFGEIGSYATIIASVIGSLFGPLILIAYSKNDHQLVQELSLDRSLTVGILLAVIVGIICGFSQVILKIWLNEEFVLYKSWLIIKLALIPFFAAAGVFSFAARAWNKVRFPALMTVVLGLVNFAVLYILAKISNKSLNYIHVMLVSGLFFGILQSYFLSGIYFSTYYPGTRKTIFTNFFKILIVLCIVFGIGVLLTPLITVLTDLWSIVVIGLISFVILLICLKVSLNKRQLEAITELIYIK